MKLISGLTEIEILLHNFLVCFVATFFATCVPRRITHLQKQPPEVFYKNKFRKIHRKTPVSESLFNIVAGLTGLTEHLRTTAFALRGAFFRNHEPDCVPEMSFSYLQNINLLPFREI